MPTAAASATKPARFRAAVACAGAHHSLLSVPPGLVHPGDEILLALSTLRHCEHAIDLALAQAALTHHLTLIYVVDQDVACCLSGADMGLVPQLRDLAVEEIMAEREAEGRRRVEPVVRRALEMGIHVTAGISRGHFSEACLSAIAAGHPALVVTTRSGRPEWARRLWGSDVDRVVAAAPCPVVEA